MKLFVRLILPLMAVLLMANGCSSSTKKTASQPVVAAVTNGWVKTELYFSIGEWTETAMSTDAENKWAVFLDTEVTPRFPEGLSVVDVYGQWRAAKAGAVLRRERSRLLVLVHRDSPEATEKIEAIRSAWKTQAGETSVLRVSQSVEASF